MGWDKNLYQYIETVNKRFQSGIAKELAYRADLEALIRELVTDVEVTNEPANVTDCGNPDYVITKGKIPIGFIEAKDLGKDLTSKSFKDQFDRYRKALDNLIITDYLWFRFYQNGELVAETHIGQIGIGRIDPLPENFDEFANLIRDFCTFVSQTIKSPKRLAEMMAAKARLLESILEKAVTSDEKTQENTSLQQQYKTFKSILIHDLKPKEFADIYSQTLAYGMFAARLHDRTLDTFSRQEAAELIPKTNPFLRKLFNHVAGVDIDDRIRTTVDNLADVFRATDVATLLKNFGRSTMAHDPFIHFYETFLAEYDPSLRKSRGVWYTPEPVVNFIVRNIDEVLKNEFGLKDGLADTSKTTIEVEMQGAGVSKGKNKGKSIKQKKEVHKVQVLDPATGTGTFLAEVVKLIYENKFKAMQGAWSGYVEEHLIPRLNGFEILMASYAMAHLKLDMLLAETGYNPKKEQRLNIFLTNSLEEFHPDTGTLFSSWLSTEANEANHVKRDTPVMVVMGNPPYSGISINKGKWISDLIEDYKYVDGVHFNERKHWLNDDYVKFIRYGQHYIDKNGEGVLAYINNHGFLDNPTFRGMRWHLLNSFDTIYIIDLHGNTLKKETCPDGSPDKNVFDIQAGVSINIFVKTGQKKKGQLAKVLHTDFWGSQESKYEKLLQNDLRHLPFNNIEYSSPYYFFTPKNDIGREIYEQGFQVNKLFEISSVGFVSANDYLNISYTKDEQVQKVNDLLNMEESAWRIKYKREKDSTTWTYLSAKQDAQQNYSDDKLIEISYRPFDSRWTLYTGNSGGVYARPIPSVMKHLIGRENVCLALSKQFKTGSQYVHAFISKFATESTYVSNRTSEITSIFPLYVFTDSNNQQHLIQQSGKRPNLNDNIISNISSGLGMEFVSEKPREHDSNYSPIDLLDYIYAVLYSPTYRDTYKEFLKIDFPRIPYPKDANIFWKLVKLGGDLRQVHLLESHIVEKFATRYPEDGDNVITRKITNTSPGYETTSDTHGKIWINDAQYFENVPLMAWEFYIGGYQPAQKWLKDRSGRKLSYEDILHYQKIIAALAETDRLMKEIDLIDIQ